MAVLRCCTYSAAKHSVVDILSDRIYLLIENDGFRVWTAIAQVSVGRCIIPARSLQIPTKVAEDHSRRFELDKICASDA